GAAPGVDLEHAELDEADQMWNRLQVDVVLLVLLLLDLYARQARGEGRSGMLLIEALFGRALRAPDEGERPLRGPSQQELTDRFVVQGEVPLRDALLRIQHAPRVGEVHAGYLDLAPAAAPPGLAHADASLCASFDSFIVTSLRAAVAVLTYAGRRFVVLARAEHCDVGGVLVLPHVAEAGVPQPAAVGHARVGDLHHQARLHPAGSGPDGVGRQALHER